MNLYRRARAEHMAPVIDLTYTSYEPQDTKTPCFADVHEGDDVLMYIQPSALDSTQPVVQVRGVNFLLETVLKSCNQHDIFPVFSIDIQAMQRQSLMNQNLRSILPFVGNVRKILERTVPQGHRIATNSIDLMHDLEKFWQDMMPPILICYPSFVINSNRNASNHLNRIDTIAFSLPSASHVREEALEKLKPATEKADRVYGIPHKALVMRPQWA